MAEKADVAAAVDEVKRLLGEGRITQAVDILGAILPVAAEQHGEHSPVVRTLRKQYAATLLDDGQYRRALPELRRLADERAAEAGQADPQSLRYRYEAAQCLEQLGEPGGGARRVPGAAGVLREPVRGRRRPAAGPRRAPPHRAPAARPRRPRRRARHAGAAAARRGARAGDPGHPLAAEIRRTLQWLGQVRG
ncbi:hypothetical protein GCM10019016_062830 [Streptomyces prasinosporus]|uniref:Tetratricopeptide repeat protein n=1 Tax=Streptomyces prasinosporus TaxID=68256 RepID=A0ABP6TWU2_9ACTN